MGVLIQAAFRGPSGGVPSPADGDKSVPWWWDHLAAQARQLRLSGFSAVLLPPVLKTQSGAFPTADGYGVFDDYDIGNKDQMGIVPTRFGRREQLQRCVAIFRANGLDVYVDTVPHQRSGGNNFVYRYRGADGMPNVGRFPKHAECFVPNVPRDPIAGPVSDDFAFGDELCPVNARPPGYVMDGLTDAGDWLTRALGVQGYRIDDVKGLAVQFVRHWLTSKAMSGQFAVGEYFDGNPQTLNWWLWMSGMAGRCNLFDFSLRFALAAMCNNPSGWDMRQLDHAGLTGISPGQAVTFVENLDTDRSEPVIRNKLLAYAYLLTAEGYPCVFYRDYSTDAECYGMRRAIDNLVWIHENLAFGVTTTRFADFQTIVYERQGYPNLLVGLNNDSHGGWRTVRVQTGFGQNVQLHDYTGKAGDVWTDGDGAVTIGVPPNSDGTGYVAYSRIGYGAPFTAQSRRVTQSFDAAADLDIPPMGEGRRVRVGRVWCRRDSPITVHYLPHVTDPLATGTVQVEVVDAAKTTLGVHRGEARQSATLPVRTKIGGWQSLVVTGTGLVPATWPFRLDVSYSAPTGLGEI
jgi:alpha-amylase